MRRLPRGSHLKCFTALVTYAALRSMPCLFHAGVEQSARGTDEWTAGKVLLNAGLLTDEQNLRRDTTLSEDGLSGVAIEVAAPAFFGGCL
jgi:hypothetical protein